MLGEFDIAVINFSFLGFWEVIIEKVFTYIVRRLPVEFFLLPLFFFGLLTTISVGASEVEHGVPGAPEVGLGVPELDWFSILGVEVKTSMLSCLKNLGGKENTFCFRGFSIATDMHFKSEGFENFVD